MNHLGVMQAYISCLNLFAAGLKVTQTFGYDSSTVAIDLLYSPAQGVTQNASIFGSQASGPATCTLTGPDITAGARIYHALGITNNLSACFVLVPLMLLGMQCIGWLHAWLADKTI